jgi:hypothetical protein
MRYQRPPFKADEADAMAVREITFEDLLGGEPARVGPPASFEQLLADGFPLQGGLEGLLAIAQMTDPDPRFAEVRRRYLQILELQRRAAKLTV